MKAPGASECSEDPLQPPVVRRSRRRKDPLQAWTQGSIWSIVCAMDLGLITESSLKNITLRVAPLPNSGKKLKTANAQTASVNNDYHFNAQGLKRAGKKKNSSRAKGVRGGNRYGKTTGLNSKTPRKSGKDSVSASNPRNLKVSSGYSKYFNESSNKLMSTNTVCTSIRRNDEPLAIPGPSWYYPPYQASELEQIPTESYYSQLRHMFAVERAKHIAKLDSSTSTADEGSDEDNAISGGFTFYPPQRNYALKQSSEAPYERARYENTAQRSRKMSDDNIIRAKTLTGTLHESSDEDHRDSTPSFGYASQERIRSVRESPYSPLKLAERNRSSNVADKSASIFGRNKYSLKKSPKFCSAVRSPKDAKEKSSGRSAQNQENNRKTKKSLDKCVTMSKNYCYNTRLCSDSSPSFKCKDLSSGVSIGSYGQSSSRDSYKLEGPKEHTDFSKIEESDDGYVTPGSSSLSSSYDILNSVHRPFHVSPYADLEDERKRSVTRKRLGENVYADHHKIPENRQFAVNNHKLADANEHSIKLENSSKYNGARSFINRNASPSNRLPSPIIGNEETNQQQWKTGLFRECMIANDNNLNPINYPKNDTAPWCADPVANYRERPHEYSEDDEMENKKSDAGPEEYTSVKHSLVYDAAWHRTATSTPVGSNPYDSSLKSPLVLPECNERNSGENQQLTFNFLSMRRELENAIEGQESNDKATIVKKVSSIHRHNRRPDFEDMHKLPLAWRIPNKGEHSCDNKENHFRKTNGGNECKRLTQSSVLSERNSPFAAPRRSKTHRTPETPEILDASNVDQAKPDDSQEIERTRRRKAILLNKLIAARNRAFLTRPVPRKGKQGRDLHRLPCKKRIETTWESSRSSSSTSKFDENQSWGTRKRRRVCGGSDDECVLKRESRLDGNSGMNIPRESQDCRDVRRITRGLTKTNKENFIGKLVWGSCSGWWPALIVDADHVGMLSEPGKLWVYWIGEARISLLNERTQIESFLHNLEVRLRISSNPARARAIDATMQLLRPLFGCNLTKPYHSWITNNVAKLHQSLDDIKFYPYSPAIERILENLKARNTKATEKYLKEMENEKEKEKSKPNDARRLNDRSKDPMYQSNPDEAQLPLKQQKPGVMAWAKIAGHFWWPAMIIDYRDCFMREPTIGCQWIMWYGDHQLSQIHHRSFLEFGKGFNKMVPYIQKTKNSDYLAGVLQAAKDYCSRRSCSTEEWTLSNVIEYFEKNPFTDMEIKTEVKESVKVSDVYTAHIINKLSDLKNNLNLDDDRQDDIENSDDLRAVINGEDSLERLCLKCLKMFDDEMDEHPFFQASLCRECSAQFKPCMFLYGTDGKCFHCVICAGSGTVIVCGKEDCPRVYCRACMKHLFCPNTYEDVMEADPWECFLCKPDSPALANFMIKPRSDWKSKLIDVFRTGSSTKNEVIENFENKRKLRVLSLFDGLSTGLLVLLKLGIEIDVYYASEIDKDALMVSNTHFGDQVIHLGDVRRITKETINEIAPIDLLIGGSPCNDLSLANPARRGLHDPEGTGILFFDYCRIKKLLKKANKGRHLFWFFENVASMPTEYRLEMNKHLGQEPDVIDSADFSPQHRLRLYWHNLPLKTRSLSTYGEQDVQDILTPNCQRYALVKKIRTVTTKVNSLKQGKFALMPILMEDECDSLWITELEEIFGFPRHYTDVKNLCATKRQKLIGRSWSVQTLTAIFRSLCPYFMCNTNPMI